MKSKWPHLLFLVVINFSVNMETKNCQKPETIKLVKMPESIAVGVSIVKRYLLILQQRFFSASMSSEYCMKAADL